MRGHHGRRPRFCAGQDLNEVTSDSSPGFKVIVEETYNRSIRRICGMEKPVVAAVNGVAAGAGANIALACDFVVAKSSAKFVKPSREHWVDSRQRRHVLGLPRLVGMARAKALTMLGTPLLATEAEAMGMIHQAVDDEAFDGQVQALATKLASMPTRGLGLTKKALHLGMTNDLYAQLALELDLQFEAAETDDYGGEGVQAFLAKRKPTFQGR